MKRNNKISEAYKIKNLTDSQKCVEEGLQKSPCVILDIMAIRVVEFSNRGTKFERFLPKNEQTQRKLLKFSKIRVLKVNYFHLLSKKKIPQIEIMA